MDTPLAFSGISRSWTAPGLLVTDTTKEVQSLPEAGGVSMVCGKLMMAKRVRL